MSFGNFFRDSLITKLKDELNKLKKDTEEMKVEKERLFSEVTFHLFVCKIVIQTCNYLLSSVCI